MKKILIALVLLSGLIVQARDVYVNGYYRSNGTYVDSHYRSVPNNTTFDNYSTRGNYNPYTGAAGTRDPYSNSNSGNYNYGNGGSNYRYNY